MAVQVYKNGVCERVEPESLQSYLANGYSLEDPKTAAPVHPSTFYPPDFDRNLPQDKAEIKILDMMGVTEKPVRIVESGADICARNNIKVINPSSTLPVQKKKPGRPKKAAAG